ncbi:MAG: hypothetical protein KDD84_06590 [Caldilineaceae bacterium]|nr:hypothetical protein [Caldilineaceae bacterium]
MSTNLILLGIAQDGGVPQAGCSCPHCTAAHADPHRRQFVACLGIVDAAAQACWMIDATPDFREQLHLLQSVAPGCRLAGILLTHAHIGHYTGLIHLGKEAWHTQALPVYASASLCAFLRVHAPWRQLVDLGNITLHETAADRPIVLSPQVTVTPIPVPHRNEWSDTVAYLVQGPTRRAFYCPDIDSWDQWDRPLRAFLDGVDVAFLDATFHSPAELPGRDLSQIPHPFAVDTAARLAGTSCDVRLIHLNHSNPLYFVGPARAAMAAQGVGVGVTGDQWEV